MKRITAPQLPSYIGKEVRLVYVGPHSTSASGTVIQVDHLITPPVKLLSYTPQTTAQIQRPDGTVETLEFYEAWDPSQVKPQ